jgi:hypothetical protein
MSRVHYDQSDAAQDVWFQPSGGAESYRWQQSASEVRILLDVPGGISAADLVVSVLPNYLRVSSVSSGAVYLEGDLEQGVDLENCVWDYDDASGVLSLYMQKSNLALFATPGDHSSTEWRRLFSDGALIKWDDSAKDYSDLPAHSMELFQKVEQQKDAARLTAYGDEAMRDASVELDEARRRTRMGRLSVMRGRSFSPWTHRGSGADPLNVLAGGRDD